MSRGRAVPGTQPAPRAHRRRLALAAKSLIAALLLAELCVRVVGWNLDGARRRARFHPTLGYIRSVAWVLGDFENSDGALSIRGQVIPRQRNEDVGRVFFVGDSTTFGVGVPVSRTFPLLFATRAAPRGLSIEALNAGIAGLTPTGANNLLREHLVGHRPDAVVLGLFMANDVNMNTADQPILTAGDPWSHLYQRARIHSALLFFASNQLSALNARKHWLTWRSDDTNIVPLPLRLVDGRGLHLMSYQDGELALYRREPDSMIEHVYATLERTLTDYRQLGEEHGFQPVVLVLPTLSSLLDRLEMRVYPGAAQRLEEVGLTTADLDYAAPTRRVLATCARLGLLCIDSTPVLATLGGDAVRPNDDHYSAAGHAALADLLAAIYDAASGRFVARSVDPVQPAQR